MLEHITTREAALCVRAPPSPGVKTVWAQAVDAERSRVKRAEADAGFAAQCTAQVRPAAVALALTPLGSL